ncbi:MAG TPA: pyruvate carboxyltransferase [Desulfurivibrionaceae bacterium]|nr:pyruvate carboxyltransferase [Desulfurivibrionaceae bacterium]
MKGLIDSTLREGGQMVGVNFTLDQKLAIVARLDRLGIEEIEVGIATRLDQELPALLAGCREMGSRARLALWCRCREEDIEEAARLKPDVLSLSIPASDLHITKKLGKNHGWVLTTLARSIKMARELGCRLISLGLEDATRAGKAFLEEIIATAMAAGIDRIRLADTVGVATPAEMADLVRTLKGRFAIEVGVHCHNDFGMASANSLAAIEAGADWADVTVYGIGERAGNARLEEVAGFLALRGRRRYVVRELKELVALAAGCCGKEIDPHHPVVGAKIFHCETGLHLQGLEIDSSTYEAYPPEAVGAGRKLLYGGKIGRRQRRRLAAEPAPGRRLTSEISGIDCSGIQVSN